MRPPEWISLKIILFQVLPVFQIGIICFLTGKFFSFGFSSCFFFAFCFSSLASPPFPQVAPLERLCPSPVEGGGWLSCGERTRLLSGTPPQWSLPFGEERMSSRQILPEEKRHFPERVARNPRKGRAGSSLSGWPQAPSGVPAVLLPFFWEDIHQFPLRVQAVSPYRRKTPRPMGS